MTRAGQFGLTFILRDLECIIPIMHGNLPGTGRQGWVTVHLHWEAGSHFTDYKSHDPGQVVP